MIIKNVTASQFLSEGYELFESVNGPQDFASQEQEVRVFKDGLYLAVDERNICKGIITILGPLWHKVAIIGHIAVLEAHRRQRIGSAMVRVVLNEQRKRGIKRVCLQTDPRCSSAVDFWRYQGFVQRSVDLVGYLGSPNPVEWLEIIL